jgi:CDP-glucose 4,6-dehydratase
MDLANPLPALSGRRVLVTGHTGFKGSWLCVLLDLLGAEVHGLALAPDTQPALFAEAGLADRLGDRHHLGDIRDLDVVRAAFAAARPEVVFHLAAQPLVLEGYRDPVTTVATNVLGTAHVLEAARASGALRAIVTVTTDKCYANIGSVWGYRENDPLGGHDPYSASKAAAEIIAESYRASWFHDAGVGAATARAGNVIGGGDWADDRIVPDAVRALMAGEPIGVRNPRAIRPWQHVLDPLFGYCVLASRLLDDPAGVQGAWNFGPTPGEECDVGALCDQIVAAWGSGAWKDHSGSDAPHEASVLRLTSEKARVQLGWRARWSSEQAIARTVAWYRSWADGEPAHDLCAAQIRAFLQEATA